MKTKKVTRLSIIEIPYGDLNWGPDPQHIKPGIYSDIQLWKKYRELDDYKLCGIYNKANVPTDITEIQYFPVENEDVYLTLTRQVSDAVYQKITNGNALLITGGYCKDAVGVCGGIQRAVGLNKKIGIIYLDAHSDMSTPELTYTGILGGMDLAVIAGVTLPKWRKAAGLKIPISGTDILLSDFREADVNDDGALPVVKREHINWIKGNSFEDETTWRSAVQSLANKTDILYLHIDADILNHIHVPNAACMAKGGPSIHTLMRNIRIIMETGKVLVYGSYGFYFDTEIPGQDSLTLSGLRSVSAGLESWKEMPSVY